MEAKMSETGAGPNIAERRRYFRITDDIHLEISPITRGAYDRILAAPDEGEEPCDIVLQLRALDSQAGSVLATIRKREPEIAHYLAILDRKVDLIARALMGSRVSEAVSPNARVNLSAGGLAYLSEEPAETDLPLLIRMVLFPSRVCVQAYGKVVHCEPAGANQFKIGVEFTAITETARDALVRHTLERQSSELRRQREQQPEPGPTPPGRQPR